MAKLTANVVLTNPESGVIELLAAGSDLPEWAVEFVGDHVLDAPAKAEVVEGDEDQGEGDGYDDLKVDDLKEAIAGRNANRKDDAKVVPAGTKKDELIAALRADDQR